MKLNGKIIIVVIGMAFVILGGLCLGGHNKVAKSCTQTTTAVVSDVEETEKTYKPVLTYKVGSREVTSTYTTEYDSMEKLEKAGYGVGDTVEIKYNPNNSTTYIVVQDNKPVIVFYAFIVIGGIVSAISGIDLIKRK